MRLGDYEIQGELGRGGMGVVHRARARDGRLVAIKVMRSGGANEAARFQRERRLLATLSETEGFVPIVDAGESAGHPWIAMPFLEGGTLRAKLVRGAMPIDDAVALGRTLALALGRAHALGIVHRDLKPENVLFDGEGRPLVADLGLARHFSTDAPGASQSVALSRSGLMLGTAGYASPEQLTDARSVGPPADVFALGAILYECLTARPAFPGESVIEVVARVEKASFTPVRRLRPEVPAWLASVVESALARDPAARPADGATLARALAGAPPSRRRSGPVVAAALVLVTVALAGIAFPRSERATATAPPSAEPRRPDAESAKLEAHAWEMYAAALMTAGERSGALAFVDRAIALEPSRARTWALRAHLLVTEAVLGGREELLRRAIDDATRAIALDAKMAEPWMSRGQARRRLGDGPGAIEDFSGAVERAPQLAASWANRAIARRHVDPEGAVSDLDRAIELAPDTGSLYAERANLHADADRMQEAFADAKKAFDLGVETRTVHLILGETRLRAGNYEAAARNADAVIALEPSLPLGWTLRAAVYGRQGDVANAIATLEKFLALGHDDARVRGGLIELHVQQRDLARAEAQLENYRRLAPNPQGARVRELSRLVENLRRELGR